MKKNITTLLTSHETVHIAIYVKVGTKHEAGYPHGIAHFTEHMLFKGTEQFDAKSFSEEIDAIGGEVNAYTTKEYTCYSVKTLKRFEERALALIEEMMTRATFPADEIEREKQVILEEIKMTEDDPEDYIYDLLQEKTLSDHYRVPILGTRESLQHISREKLLNFYRTFYTGDNMVISYAGQRPDAIDGLQLQEGETTTRLTDFSFSPCQLTAQRTLEQAHFLLGFEGVGYHHPLYDAYSVFSSYFGESMSSPLFRRLREELGLCYNVYSSLEAFENGGLFTIYMACDAQHIEAAKNEIFNLLKQPLTEEQLSRTKNYLITSAYMDNDYDGHIMARNGRSIMYYGHLISLETFEAHINAVTLEQIAKVQMFFATEPAQILFK
ncbi:insulinase family protein [Macrococcus hajekii]|uniref:Insulinase family protein n=1 Tax=Macrococcus hajekii TaxID=198482 RepID=A0A4R6BN26_9STAP|nr:pitrilysin family protein [Macrococcus hajekii]TDM03148.1 insulinase family protein [Macrococcus hajekii]GGA96346.1 putative zinc protease YmxG [Macrococcus hajekii]